jgi:LPS-assembly protein
MLRRLALLAALLPAASALAQQIPFAAAPAKDEKGPMTIDAERMDGVGEIEMTARGRAEIRQDEMSIFGDYLKYNRELGWVDAHDGVRLELGVDRFFGPKLRYNTLDDTGVFEQPTFILRRESTARGTAQEVEFRGKDLYRMKKATYTTCEPGRNDWTLEAEELDLNYETDEGTAKHPRLRFFDTTILAAPFAFFPLENSRKSGLLSPYYAHSNTRGLEFGIPYYWNIAPEYDYTLTPIYMTKRGLMLKNEGRYINPTYRGEARVEYMPGDTELKRERHGISWQHTQNWASSGTGLVIDYNRVSDDRYFVDLASQVRQSSIGNLQQDAYVTKGGALFGSSVNYGAMFRVQKFQTLQDPNAPITPPYHRVPQINFTPYKNDIGGFLDATAPSEYVRFTHPTLVEGSRITTNPTVSAPLLTPGWFVTPRAGLRTVQYGLQNTGPGVATSPRISIPWASMDAGLIYDRETRWFGENLTQTLEPRLYYVYVPYRNQDAAPIFDTGLADFNFAQLFSENRFGGGDRFGDANQLTAAATTRFLQANGQEAFRATFGQRFYFADERVALTPGAPLRTFGHSDYLASIGGRVFRHVTFDTTAQYNPRDHRPERYTASARYSPEVAKVISASYRYNRDPAAPVKQIDVSGQWPVRAGWYAVGRYNYSILDKRLVDGVAALEYNAGCWVFRAAMQRIQAAAQVTSTAVYFQLVFTGAGELGTDEVLTLLRRNVPGYSVTNPSDPTLAPPSLRRPLPFPMQY